MTLPRLTDRELGTLYDEAYFDDWLEQDAPGAIAGHRRRAAFLTTLRRPGRLLDVGCGTGLFLAASRELSWQVWGVEPSVQAAARAKAALGIEPAASSIFELESEPYDAITFWHSLEHHAEPRAALKRARALLVEGGLALVECPNVASLPRWAAGSRWDAWHLPWHRVHYSPRTLRQELERAGLHVRGVRVSPWAALSAALRRARGLHGRSSSGDGMLAAPSLLRHDQDSVSGRLVRFVPGRDMLILAERR